MTARHPDAPLLRQDAAPGFDRPGVERAAERGPRRQRPIINIARDREGGL
jgi:hypothetical protein